MLVDVCDRPVFVLAAPGSVGGHLAAALGTHARLWAAQESDFLAGLFAAGRRAHAAGTARGRLHWLSGQGVDYPEFMGRLGAGVNALFTARAGGRRWIDHSPVYTHYGAEIALMFPGAQFVTVAEDGRGAVTRLRALVDHEEACRIWARAAGARHTFERTAGVPMYRVDRTDLQERPREVVEAVLDFLGEAGVDTVELPPQPATADTEWTAAEEETFARIAGAPA